MKSLPAVLMGFVVLVVFLLVVPFLIPKRIYRDRAIHFIESRYPVRLTLEDVSLTLLPEPGLTLEGAAIQMEGAEAGLPPPFQAQKMKVTSTWRSLLVRKPSLSLFMKDTNVQLIEVEKGKFSIAPLIAAFQSPPQEPSQELPVRVRKIELQNLNVVYKPFREAAQNYSSLSLLVYLIKQDPEASHFDVFFKGKLPQIQGRELEMRGNCHLQKNEISTEKTSFKIDGVKALLSGKIITQDPLALDLKLTLPPTPLSAFAALMPTRDNSLRDLHGDLAALVIVTGTSKQAEVTLKADSPKLLLSQEKLPVIEKLNLTARTTVHPGESAPPVTGEISAQKIETADVILSKFSGRFVYQDSHLKIIDLAAETMDGSIAGNADLHLETPIPKYTFDVALKNISVEKIPSVKNLVKGKGDLVVQGRGEGFKTEEWTKNLDGSGSLSVRNIEIPSLNVFEQVESSPAWSVAEKIPGVVSSDGLHALNKLDSKVSDLTSAFRIVNGLIQVPKVSFKFPQALANLSGGIGLDKRLDFNGTLNLDKPLVESFIRNPQLSGALVQDHESLALPIQVLGTVSNPVVTLSHEVIRERIQSYLQSQAQQKAGQILQKPEEVPSKIQDFLKKF